MKKKYILKPGRHQFAPGSPAVHANDNLTDEDAEWYLEKYPHIAGLFEESPKVGKSESPEDKNQPDNVAIINNKSEKSDIIGETERSDLMNTAEKQSKSE